MPNLSVKIDSIPAGRIFTVGTLRYTLWQLCLVSSWLLLGSFWYNFLETVLVPTLMPINFHLLGATGAVTGIALGSIPSALNIMLNPVISTLSDRTRTRFGRRMPYIFAALPVMLICTILLGWLPVCGQHLTGKLMLVIYSIVYILMYLANMVIGTAMSYLKPDVIPEKCIGRLQAGTLILSSVSGFFFNRYVMRFVPGYTPWIFTGAAILIAASFAGVWFFVREGGYPPPESASDKTGFNAVSHLKNYFKECFADRFYLYFFIGLSTMMMASVCRMLFCVLFATQELKLTAAEYGEIMSFAALAGAAAALIMFFVIDNVNPLGVFIGSAIPVFILDIAGFYFADGFVSFATVGILMIVVYIIQNLSIIPALVMLLPKAKFGQFVSAYVAMCGIVGFISNYLCGKTLDIFGYRALFAWDGGFVLLSVLFLLKIFPKAKSFSTVNIKSHQQP